MHRRLDNIIRNGQDLARYISLHSEVDNILKSVFLKGNLSYCDIELYLRLSALFEVMACTDTRGKLLTGRWPRYIEQYGIARYDGVKKLATSLLHPCGLLISAH